MIQYNPFWITLKNRNITAYTLRTKYNINSATLTRMRKNKPISTTTIDDLCSILHCRVDEIIIHIDDSKDNIRM